MKKFFLSLLVALMAVSAEAQVTWNVRAGGGISSLFYDDNGITAGVRFVVQSNIPFTKDGRWMFSPTFSFSIGIGGTREKRSNDFIFPLYIGYKAPIGHNVIFSPKLGPVFGFRPGKKDTEDMEFVKTGFIAGPSVELSFEIKHFVVALNGYYSFVKQKPYDGASLAKVLPEELSDYRMGRLYYYFFRAEHISEYPLYGASLTLGYTF